MTTTRLRQRRICWPTPDKVCLQGGCIYCADGPDSQWVSETELNTYAQAKDWNRHLEVGWANPNITQSVLTQKDSLQGFTDITVEQVADFALGTLEEWMTGYTPATEDMPVQYRVIQMVNTPPGELWMRFEPLTYSEDGYTKRPTNVYSIRVTVTEMTHDVI